jgi:hypothetical protein
MPLAEKLSELESAAEALRQAEDGLEAARERFRAALVAARDAGASLALLGRNVGLSRQRVAQIIEREP